MVHAQQAVTGIKVRCVVLAQSRTN
eukprot:Gb_41084 [translate_table: standard]